MGKSAWAASILAGVLGSVCALAGAAADPAARTYAMRGVLRSSDPAAGRVTVTHEAVPGLMPAMTMEFDLATPADLQGLRPGDTFTCQLRVTDDGAWIGGVRRVDVPPISPFGDTAPAIRATELAVGDLLPDVALVDQTGATVHLHDFGGKPLALAFIYLRCALPTYCPLLNRNFRAASTLLERLGLQGQARFLSVSMDPGNDTPPHLAEYAAAYGTDPQTWIFATAEEPVLRQLGGAVGLEFEHQNGVINHNLRTVVLDGERRIRRIFRGNTWTPQELAAELRAAAVPRG